MMTIDRPTEKKPRPTPNTQSLPRPGTHKPAPAPRPGRGTRLKPSPVASLVEVADECRAFLNLPADRYAPADAWVWAGWQGAVRTEIVRDGDEPSGRLVRTEGGFLLVLPAEGDEWEVALALARLTWQTADFNALEADVLARAFLGLLSDAEGWL